MLATFCCRVGNACKAKALMWLDGKHCFVVCHMFFCSSLIPPMVLLIITCLMQSPFGGFSYGDDSCTCKSFVEVVDFSLGMDTR